VRLYALPSWGISVIRSGEETVIASTDPLLTSRQRRALLEVYDSFVAINGGRAALRGKGRQA
jgi:hypothetical protein